MPTTKRAETAEELREKYGKKRLTAKTAPKVYLFNFVYWAYLTNENKQIDPLKDRIVKDEAKAFEIIMEHPHTQGMYTYYCTLCIWINTAFESAVLVRNSLDEFLSEYYDIAATALAGENLKRELGDQAEDEKVALWLNTLTVDHYRPTGEHYHKIIGLKYSIRENIDNYRRYVNAYNTLINTIANAIDVPELTVYKVDTNTVEDRIARLNDALDALRDEIKKREIVPQKQPLTSLFPPFTPKEMEETLKAFAPISKDVQPVPDENITKIKAKIKDLDIASTAFNGDTYFRAITENYWRR